MEIKFFKRTGCDICEKVKKTLKFYIEKANLSVEEVFKECDADDPNYLAELAYEDLGNVPSFLVYRDGQVIDKQEVTFDWQALEKALASDK